MNALSAEEMERFQRLSDTYQPNLEVAFISPSARKQTSDLYRTLSCQQKSPANQSHWNMPMQIPRS